MRTTVINIHRLTSKLMDESREREQLAVKLIEGGFTTGHRPVRGFIPHFQRGDDLVFIANAAYYIGRIMRMKIAYEGYPGKVYVVVTRSAPKLVVGDLLASKLLLPLNTDLVPYTWQMANTTCEPGAITPLHR